MADEWIKVRTKLARDGRVRVAAKKCHAPTVTAFGALVTLWCLGDEHADEAGVIYGYTAQDVDEYVGVPGFCEALPAEWIDLTGEWVKLPNYQHHNGTTAKSRSGAAKRQQQHRSRKGVTGEPPARDKCHGDTVTPTVTREEKRREELEARASSIASGVDLRPAAPENRSLNGDGLVVIDGDGAPLSLPALTDDQARTVTLAAIALRKLGCKAQPHMASLVDAVLAGATVEQLALTAAELALRKAGMYDDPDYAPDLLELHASGASAERLHLTAAQYAELRASAPSLNYLVATLRGRADDAARGATHAPRFDRAGGPAAHESAAERAERLCRLGDARDDALGRA